MNWRGGGQRGGGRKGKDGKGLPTVSASMKPQFGLFTSSCVPVMIRCGKGCGERMG